MKSIYLLILIAVITINQSCNSTNTQSKVSENTNSMDTVITLLNDSVSELKIFQGDKLFTQGKTLYNLKDDYWVFYYPDGKTIKTEGFFWKDLKAFNWGEYYSSGEIKSLMKYSIIAAHNDSTDYQYKSYLNLRRMVDKNDRKIMDSCFYYSINGNVIDFVDTMNLYETKTLNITYINPSFGKLYLKYGNYIHPFFTIDHTKEPIIKEFTNHVVQIELKAEKLGMNHFVSKITDFKTDSDSVQDMIITHDFFVRP